MVMGRLGLKRVRPKTRRTTKMRRRMRSVTQMQILRLRFFPFVPPPPFVDCVSMAAFGLGASDANMGIAGFSFLSSVFIVVLFLSTTSSSSLLRFLLLVAVSFFLFFLVVFLICNRLYDVSQITNPIYFI